MTDRGKMLIYIPKDENYIEILGHRIDGFESFEAFCEHLNKYAELEETVNRQKAEIERLQKHNTEYARKHYNDGRAEAITEFAERLKGVYINDKRYDRPNPHTLLIKLFANIDQIAKEMKGEQ